MSSYEYLRSGAHASQPRQTAVTFLTTEHLTLEGARTAAISESTSRATIFIGAVSDGPPMLQVNRPRSRRIGFTAKFCTSARQVAPVAFGFCSASG